MSVLSAKDLIAKDIAEAFLETKGLERLKGAKVLITGATGFMGGWLLEAFRFLNDERGFGCRVMAVSRNATRFQAANQRIGSRRDIEFVDRDVRDLLDIPGDFSYVIHAAANPDNRVHSSDPLRTMTAISHGTEAVLEAALRLPDLKKFLYVSSGLVYGAQPAELERIPETYAGGPNCAAIMSVYSEAKRYAETFCAAYRSQYKMPILTVRPFAFIGPGQLLDKPWAVNNFINDALRGHRIGILGDPATVRSYMYPSEMAFWLLTMLASDRTGTYNVGSPDGITLESLAGKIASHFTPAPEILSAGQEARKVGFSRFVPDVSAANAHFGLSVKIGIDEAVRRTLVWHRGGGK